MKVAEYIASFVAAKTKVFWGYIGGFNADILEKYCDLEESNFVLNYHEQAAAFAANAYSIIKEKPAFATASGAPSACNLIAGIANAYFDSNPCVFIVGSPHSLAVRKDKKTRQNAFEEIDFVHMVSDITKYAVVIKDPADVKYELEKAYYIANHGRKGPVVIDVPYNVAREEIIDSASAYNPPSKIESEFNPKEVLDVIRNSSMPVMLVGGGARGNEVREYLKKFLTKIKLPVVASLCGLDVLSHDHECFCGFIGHYGNRYANLAVANTDCLIVLGSRLDERQLGGFRTRLNDKAAIIRVDIDRAELGRKFTETLSYQLTVADFLRIMTEFDFNAFGYPSWIETIHEWKKRFPSHNTNTITHSPNNFVNYLSDVLTDDCIICADVGQNQMTVAQSLKLEKKRRLINSAGYGSMGFSLPAAIGAAFASPETMVISVNGDGGIQMNIQELHVLVREKLPINVIVFNNSCLGMIRKTQEKLFNGKTFVSVDNYSTPGFENIAKGYGIEFLKIENTNQYDKLISFLSDKEPRFIEVVFPIKVENNPEPGDVIWNQTPNLTEEEFEQVNEECIRCLNQKE